VLSGHYDHWKVLAELEVEEDCDYVDFTGLDINRDWEYYLDMTIKNPTSSYSAYYLFAEGDYTVTNYYRQLFGANGSDIEAKRSNNASIGFLSPGRQGLFNVKVTRDPGGYPRYTSISNRYKGSIVNLEISATSKTAPVSNITSLRVSAEISGAIGAGSRFILARVRG